MVQSLPKSNILRGYQRFGTIINNGICISQPHLSCYVLLATTETHGDSKVIGFSVPKKYIPLAVHRNRIKRLMREAVRKTIHEWKLPEHYNRAEIVLLYKGKSPRSDTNISLNVFETEWSVIRQRIGEMQ